MTDTPNYYAIITANVRYDNRLTDSEKLLFAEITALSNKNGYCSASNGYFSKLYEVSKVTISRRIAKLKEAGYLKIDLVKKGKEVKHRKMYPLSNSIIPINRNDNTPINNSDNTPINRNDKENNTSNNNTRDNNINRIGTMSGNPTNPIPPYAEVIEYLNNKTGKKYKYTTKKTQSLIKARTKEGFTLDDFKRVIDNMASQWLEDSKMNQYLRPETLFGTKFEGYLNQQVTEAEDESWQNQYLGVF